MLKFSFFSFPFFTEELDLHNSSEISRLADTRFRGSRDGGKADTRCRKLEARRRIDTFLYELSQPMIRFYGCYFFAANLAFCIRCECRSEVPASRNFTVARSPVLCTLPSRTGSMNLSYLSVSGGYSIFLQRWLSISSKVRVHARPFITRVFVFAANFGENAKVEILDH